MRDPLRDPKYGDVFEWVNGNPVQPMVMYLCTSDPGITNWTGLTLISNGVKQPGETYGHWLSLDGNRARALGAHWRVVERAL